MEGQQESALGNIGKYKIIGTLGRGSMGVVYKARDPEIGRVVAVKTLRKIMSGHFHDADSALQRFNMEARSAGNLRHPNIITIFEVNRDGDTPYIVMDFLEGEGLEVVIQREKKLTPQLMLHYLTQAAAGLDYAHTRGVLHRDIKPSNMLVDASGNLFILDFGIASISGSFKAVEAADANSNTVMGTPGYMSPEQILNETLDNRTDLFSLAIVAFECLTGQRPFPGNNFTEVVGNILNAKPLSLTSLAPELPLALEAEFERALARQREDRFHTADQMITAFREALGLESPDARIPLGNQANPRRRRHSTLGKALRRKYWGTEKTRSEDQGDDQNSAENGVAPNGLSGAAAAAASSTGIGTRPIILSRGPLHNQSADVRPRSIKPSAGVFGHSDESFIDVLGRQRLQRGPAPLLVLGFVFMLLGGVILWVLIDSESDILPETAGPSEFASSTTGPQIVNSESGIVPPPYDPVPMGKTLNEMNDRELVGALISRVSSETELLSALKEAHRRSLPALVDASAALLQNDSYILRVETLKVLGEIGDKRIVPNVMVLLDDHDPSVRTNAARALGKLGDRRALGYLSARQVKEDSVDVKLAIKAAIDRINGFSVK